MGLVLTTAPTKDPVSLDEVKQWLRISSGDTSQEQIITTLIKACTRSAELCMKRSLIAQTLTWEADSEDIKSPIYLPRPGINSITSFTTYDSAGASTLVSSSNYELVEALFIVARNDGWTINRRRRAATIVYSAGIYTNRADVPDDIRLAILKMIGTHYQMRQDAVPGTIVSNVTQDAYSLLKPYEYWRP